MASTCDELDITTRDGVARAWAYTGREGSRPGLILYPDAFGARAAMHGMARRLAGLGYVVLLPKVFYRAGAYAPFNPATVWSDPPERDRLMALIHSMTPARVEMDASAYLDALAARPGVRPDRLGAVGYCMGGRIAFLTAALHADRCRAAASFHGGRIVTDGPDSPHRLASRIRGSLYLGVADSDASCTPAHQGALASALAEAHVDYRLELYPGKRHGFAVPDHAAAYDRDAAERHWRRVESFFGETLE